MDQGKIGRFLKENRLENNLTQEQLAERLGVSRRTVSRRETGSNLPDLDLLIELSDLYALDLRELLDGERKETTMQKELEETVRKVADYSSERERRLKRRLHALYWIGLAQCCSTSSCFGSVSRTVRSAAYRSVLRRGCFSSAF